MENILGIACSRYGIQESNLTPLRGGHFAQVYIFARDGIDLILRLSPPNKDVDIQAQRSIIDWMAFLANQGAAVPQPQQSLDGNLIEVISTENGDWLAVVLTRAAGILSEELPFQQWNRQLFQSLGTAIGKVHAISRKYNPRTGINFPQWDQGGNMFSRSIQNEPWLIEKQSHILEHVRGFPRTPETFGLIHGDLHFGNFFIDEPSQIITLIDFDDCCYGWFSMDIAILLFDILVLYQGNDKKKFGHDFMASFTAGYIQENPLPQSWLKQVPLFMKLLEINLYDMVAKYYPNDKDVWVQKFMPGRKECIQNNTPYFDMSSIPS